MKHRSEKKQNQPSSSTPAFLNSILPKRILVPIDFSAHSKNALRYAIPFAKHFQAELVLVYVVEPAVYPADFSFGQVSLPDLEHELRERAKRELERLLEAEIRGQVAARTIVRTGKAFLEIISTAKEENTDLIIIATHGHTGVEHILFGSTAEKVVRKAPCPVLSLRPTEDESLR